MLHVQSSVLPPPSSNPPPHPTLPPPQALELRQLSLGYTAVSDGGLQALASLTQVGHWQGPGPRSLLEGMRAGLALLLAR